MMEPERLKRLGEVAAMIREVRLADLRQAARARAESRERLAGLDLPAAPTDLPPIVAGQAEVRYQIWADARRAEINILLARQTAEWREAHAAARTAFGRAQALERLSQHR